MNARETVEAIRQKINEINMLIAGCEEMEIEPVKVRYLTVFSGIENLANETGKTINVTALTTSKGEVLGYLESFKYAGFDIYTNLQPDELTITKREGETVGSR